MAPTPKNPQGGKLSPEELWSMLSTGAKADEAMTHKTDDETADLLFQLKGDKNMFGPEYAIIESAETRLRRANGGPIGHQTLAERRLVLVFDNNEYRKSFIGWLMNSGEQQWGDVLEMDGMPFASAAPADGAAEWEWAGDPDEDAHQYTVAMTVNAEPVPQEEEDGRSE